VFDFDDTLAWAPSWYNEATIDGGGYVSHPGGSIALRRTIALLPDDFKLQLENSGKEYHRDIFFLIMHEGAPVMMDDLIDMFSIEEMNYAGIDRYEEQAVVITDFLYYNDPDTVGFRGFNKYILDLYRENADNALILTARQSHPGIRERILKFICTAAPEPLEIITQPLNSRDSGLYKGEVLVNIAKHSNVTHVYFYDDNINYIHGVRKVVDVSGFKDKITIEHVNTNNKPQHC
jgi:hypothetical protein